MKKKKKQTQNRQKKQQDSILHFNEKLIDEETLALAMVKAYQIVEEKKKAQEVELENNEKKEWQEALGQKEFPENEKWIWKKIHAARNDLFALWNILFFKSKNVKDMRTTMVLMQLAVMGMFAICKWCLYLLSIAGIYSLVIGQGDYIPGLSITLVAWMFARIFRIAAFEIEKMKDGNLLIAIFSGCVSFAAMVVAIIALFCD